MKTLRVRCVATEDWSVSGDRCRSIYLFPVARSVESRFRDGGKHSLGILV